MNRTPKALVLASLLVLAACVIGYRGSVSEVEAPETGEPTAVETAMKAFLSDGSTVVYPNGALISRDSVVGPGTRYSLGLRDSTTTNAVPMDSLVGIEAYHSRVDPVQTFFGSVLATGLTAVIASGLAVAIFGSCPTFYALPEHGGALQAEAFSYSIAPLLEARDLDVTDLVVGDDGVLRMELRNEALETHYINHLELLTVDHQPGVRVLSDDREGPVGVVDELPPVTARDRSGRTVLRMLTSSDDLVFASPAERIRTATEEDRHDWIELTFPKPSADTAVVSLRLRNSLLTTVLFYDMMLGRAGARAVDWIGRDMTRIGTVVELGRWFQDAMGMRVEVFDGTAWRSVGRVSDTGPIAWEDVGVRIPVPEAADSLSVRLSFFTDAWRIDRVALGRSAPLLAGRRVPLARMSARGTSAAPEVLERLARPDDDYLITHPGTSAWLEFDVAAPEAGLDRAVLLSSQGYYTEWVRRDWIQNAEQPTVFRPGAETVETLMALWTEKKDAFEARFHDSRIPVR